MKLYHITPTANIEAIVTEGLQADCTGLVFVCEHWQATASMLSLTRGKSLALFEVFDVETEEFYDGIWSPRMGNRVHEGSIDPTNIRLLGEIVIKGETKERPRQASLYVVGSRKKEGEHEVLQDNPHRR